MKTGRFVVGILCFLLAGCCHRVRPPHAGIRNEANEARIAAMVTIHAYAFFPDGKFPEGWRPPMSLEQAASYLRSDTDPLAGSRRRRAIGKLAAYGLERPDFRAALRTLGADPDYIERQLELLARRRHSSRRCDTVTLTPSQRETFVDDLYANVSAPTCPWKNLVPVPPVVGAPVMSTAVTISVQVPLDKVKTRLDPQQWASCSKFFRQTYLAKRDALGNIVPDQAVTPGTAYGGVNDRRNLFEYFTCDGTGSTCWFTNFLAVMSWDEKTAATTVTCPLPDASAARYNIYYGIRDALGGAINGVRSTIRIDNGQGCAQPDDPGWTRAYISKGLEIDNPVSNGIYQGLMAATFSELGEEFAELLCCGATPVQTPVQQGTP